MLAIITFMAGTLDVQRGDSLQTVLERLSEAIEWCHGRVDLNDPKNCLRSMALLPHPLENGRKAVVGSVAIKRFLALGRPERRAATDLRGGRLLIYEPDVNLCHGLEEEETRGFVDHDNTPPWDTWVAYVCEGGRSYLLNWVPGEFVSLVSKGIDISPEQSFRWLDGERFLLTEMLRKLRLA
jgi:hypothetical protein